MIENSDRAQTEENSQDKKRKSATICRKSANSPNHFNFQRETISKQKLEFKKRYALFQQNSVVLGFFRRRDRAVDDIIGQCSLTRLG